MSFRRRVVLLSAGAVAAAIVLASALVYVLTANQLRGQVDTSLRERLKPGGAESVRVQAAVAAGSKLARLAREGKLGPRGGLPAEGPGSGSGSGAAEQAPPARSGAAPREGRSLSTQAHGSSRRLALEGSVVARDGAVALPEQLPPLGAGEIAKLVLPQKGLGATAGYIQLVQSNGKILRSSDARGETLPVTPAVRAVAAGRRGSFFSDIRIDGTPMRVLVERAPPAGVWQVALPLTETDNTLSQLRLVLAIVSLGGILVAAALGLLVSRAAVRPVRRLTRAAERVARTQDLGHRIRVGGSDELGSLSASFNTMLAALERSRLAQRQLISDASHELRTPLTSIQANLDALALGERLPAEERARVLAAAQAQLRELGLLVGDLVDLSKTEFEVLELEDLRLDLAAEGALRRARLHAPRCRFELDAQPCLIRAEPARLDRAIANLLDNAVKWGPPEGPVEVRVADGAIHVRDHGPGIDPDDLPRVFDRFYRSPAARSRPGSGLGLAIVRQVAEASGGSVHAANDPAGGARLVLELPQQPLGEEAQAAEEPGESADGRGESADGLQGAPRGL